MHKKLYFISFFFFLASCIEKDCDVPGHTEGAELQIIASISLPRAVSKLTFSENDAIGIYLVSYVNGQPGTMGDVRDPQNREYVYNEGIWHPVSGTELYLHQTLNDLYAYYPYDPEIGNTAGKMNAGSYPYSVPSDQSESTSGIDFLWGKTEALSLTNNRANILFQHLLTRVVINLYNNNGDISEITDVQLHNFQTSCTINLRTGTITPTGTVVPIIPSQRVIPETGYDVTYESIVIPGTIAGDAPVLSAVYNGERLLYTFPAEQELISGTTYTLNLTIGSAQPAAISVQTTF